MRISRLKVMEEYINEKDMVTMDELCSRFNISLNTARTDVGYLVNKGVARKVYGGVCKNQTSRLAAFEKRRLNMLSSKKEIGRYASTLVEDGDIIFIDSGSTTMHMIDYMDHLQDVTIITHSLEVFNKAVSKPNLTIISLPGALDRKTNSFMQANTQQALEVYNIDKAFMAATSISYDGSINNMSVLECEIKKTAIRRSKKIYLLADSSKFGKSTLMTFGHINEMEMVITDNLVDKRFITLCSQLRVKTRLVDAMQGDRAGGEKSEKSNPPA